MLDKGKIFLKESKNRYKFVSSPTMSNDIEALSTPPSSLMTFVVFKFSIVNPKEFTLFLIWLKPKRIDPLLGSAMAARSTPSSTLPRTSCKISTF